RNDNRIGFINLNKSVVHHRGAEFTENQRIRAYQPLTQRVSGCFFKPMVLLCVLRASVVN
ncbi:MAG: hypothetical protein ACU83U_02010, partial [Gammaproteobacteria bacterium]